MINKTNLYSYIMEPGDGTRYEFAWTWLRPTQTRLVGGHSGQLIRLFVTMGSWQGYADLDANELRCVAAREYYRNYVSTMLQNVPDAVLGPILRAMVILVEDNENIHLAAERMIGK